MLAFVERCVLGLCAFVVLTFAAMYIVNLAVSHRYLHGGPSNSLMLLITAWLFFLCMAGARKMVPVRNGARPERPPNLGRWILNLNNGEYSRISFRHRGSDLFDPEDTYDHRFSRQAFGAFLVRGGGWCVVLGATAYQIISICEQEQLEGHGNPNISGFELTNMLIVVLGGLAVVMMLIGALIYLAHPLGPKPIPIDPGVPRSEQPTPLPNHPGRGELGHVPNV